MGRVERSCTRAEVVVSLKEQWVGYKRAAQGRGRCKFKGSVGRVERSCTRAGFVVSLKDQWVGYKGAAQGRESL